MLFQYRFILSILFISLACGFADDDTYIITGGWNNNRIVSKYDKNGWIEDLPNLNNGRSRHGCGTFVDDNSNKVSWDYYKILTTRVRGRHM